jgi:hypothetical protein
VLAPHDGGCQGEDHENRARPGRFLAFWGVGDHDPRRPRRSGIGAERVSRKRCCTKLARNARTTDSCGPSLGFDYPLAQIRSTRARRSFDASVDHTKYATLWGQRAADILSPIRSPRAPDRRCPPPSARFDAVGRSRSARFRCTLCVVSPACFLVSGPDDRGPVSQAAAALHRTGGSYRRKRFFERIHSGRRDGLVSLCIPSKFSKLTRRPQLGILQVRTPSIGRTS